MEPHETNILTHAKIDPDGRPRCDDCSCDAKVLLQDGPEMVPDASNPTFCKCPECNLVKLTPTPMALSLIAARLA